jgi:SAM-dependent methyltransferase
VARVDYTDRAGAYRRARTLPAHVLEPWTAAVAPIAAEVRAASRDRGGRPGAVLDLGAGPGGFLDPLAEWFDAPVVAVEPSEAMRAEARAAGTSPRFAYVGGRAEQIPLAGDVADVAWLSTVVHQFDDLGAAAAELRRTVRPGGLVLVRGFFADLSLTGLFGHFPGIGRSAATFPLTDAVVETFAAAGFGLRHVVDVVEPWTFELGPWTERVRAIRHTDSALRPLTDDEVEAGIASVQAAHGAAAGPIVSDTVIRLLVLGGPGSR